MDARSLNSLTKYPSIPTWHVLDGKGVLTDSVTSCDPSLRLALTEKVDGTNGRIVRRGDSWWIGSREELLAASDGSIPAPSDPLAARIVAALRPTAEALLGMDADRLAPGFVGVWYLEVYGSGIGPAHKDYASGVAVGARVFDRAYVEDADRLLALSPDKLSIWRKRGGQSFYSRDELAEHANWLGLDAVPELGEVAAAEMPVRLEDGRPFIERWVGPRTRCALDEAARGRPEGIVARTHDRGLIVKLRLEDYDRALRRTAAK